MKRTAESAGYKFKREAAIHISNVALIDAESNEIIKVGFQNVVGEDGNVVAFASTRKPISRLIRSCNESRKFQTYKEEVVAK